MSRYIDADKLIEEVRGCSYDTWAKDVNRAWWAQAVMVKDNIVECIKRQPTADVIEVVRCKDCKYAYINSFSALSGEALCGFWTKRADGVQAIMQQDDYCSYGERREG